jgi:hypothetical protein
MSNTIAYFLGSFKKGLYRILNGSLINYIKGDNGNGNTNCKYGRYEGYRRNKGFLPVVVEQRRKEV